MVEPYLDIDWYKKIYGKQFRNSAEAAEYYLAEGERQGEWPNAIFDPLFYGNCASLAPGQSSLEHFIKNGAINGCRPSRYFDAEWYRWQNPDVNEVGCSVLHYLRTGGREHRDPSPEVDMVALGRAHGELGDGCILTHMISAGRIAVPNPAITTSDKDLVARQRSFLSEIKPELDKTQDSTIRGKNLLFVQCASGSEFWSWFKPRQERDWDLFLNCYAGDFPQTNAAEYVCRQPGTKFTGMLNSWLEFWPIFERYNYVFFIDDDLVFRFEDISLFFKLMESYKLDLAQPSLSRGSQCVWEVFFNARRRGFRQTNGVEIMMPALSRRARSLMIPYFLYSVSGFGLDLLMAKLAESHGLASGVIDDIVARHEKKIDQTSGSYYEYLRSKGINSKYELWRLITMFGLDRSLHALK